MEQFHEGKETSCTLKVHGENNVQITSLPSPSRATGGREERSFEEKVTVCLSWNKPSIFFITVYFFLLFHEISRDIIGSSNSINEHSQPVH